MSYTEDQLTPWSKRGQKPVRIGVYEREGFEILRYSFWDGRKWMCAGESPSDAMRNNGVESSEQRSIWRGLNFDPANQKGVN